MKRFSAPPAVYPDPSRPPDDDDSDASLSDGSKKVKTAQSFESLFNSESLSDITIDINGGEFVFHAHKMIVGLKSERLAALITGAASIPTDNSGKPVLFLQETPDCSAVFSRFLYFIYSGAVWLHRDYVVPLFKLSIKYGVGALATHCENYIVQLLNRVLNQDSLSSTQPQTLPVSTACDLCEDDGYRDETRKIAFRVLCRRFSDLVRTERWISCSWVTVRDLLQCDECCCEENLILVSATDWMKRNRIQDKARIQEILSAIRYPRLPRRVLYHLHATASFRKFPPVQDLIDAAIRYHCFRDVPEAQNEFTGLQYRARGLQRNNRNTLCGGEFSSTSSICATDEHSCHQEQASQDQQRQQLQHQQQQQSETQSNGARATTGDINGVEQSRLLNSSTPVRYRSRSYDRSGSPHRDRLINRRNCAHRHATVLDSLVTSFHSSCSPVAAVQPRIQGQADSPIPIETGDETLSSSSQNSNAFSHTHRKT